MSETISQKDYHTQVVGAGPAGLGIAVAADRLGVLDSLLREGLLFLDKQPLEETGSGDFRDLRINSNSPGADYLESISPTGVFAEVLESDSGRKLREQSESIVPLTLVAEFLGEIRKKLFEVIKGYTPSDFIASAEISRVLHLPGHGRRTFVSETIDSRRFPSEHLVLATGGREVLIDLGSYNEKLFLSGSVLHGDQAIADIRARLQQHPFERVAILGGSHSAFSVAWRLLQEVIHGDFPFGCIDILHRGPIRLFYESIFKAVEEGYIFDQIQDVCPPTGRVNRFSGLRGDAKALYLAIVRELEPHVRFVSADGSEEREVRESLHNSAAIVQAFGYGAATVPVFESQKNRIGPRLKKNGQLDIREDCRVLSGDGSPIPHLYALGLGHGTPPDPALGGEPSFCGGVLDGVNLYHGIIAVCILKQIFMPLRL